MKINLHPLLIRSGAVLLLALPVLSRARVEEKTPEPPKPKVRAITAFIHLDRERYQIEFSEAIQFLKIAKTTFESRDQTVQTLPSSTPPSSPSLRTDLTRAQGESISGSYLFFHPRSGPSTSRPALT